MSTRKSYMFLGSWEQGAGPEALVKHLVSAEHLMSAFLSSLAHLGMGWQRVKGVVLWDEPHSLGLF